MMVEQSLVLVIAFAVFFARMLERSGARSSSGARVSRRVREG